MGRAPCCDKANVKKGPWSPDEDATLKLYVETHGTAGTWIALPTKAGLKRCGKSCRLRWLNYLRPNIKHGDFTEDEDNLIFNLYNQYGSRWSSIASQLPGRTDNDVKNHWNTKLKKKKLLVAAGKTKLQTMSTDSHPDSKTSQTISNCAGFDSVPQFQIPNVSRSSFSDMVPGGSGYGRDEWGLMEDWGCDFSPDMVCSMFFKEKNGKLCL